MNSMIREQERVANNLANANTVGYKRQRTFTETLDEYVDYEGAPRSVRSVSDWASLEQGELELTGNPLDVAIRGEGFFVLSDAASGEQRYTRAGHFLSDSDGLLRDPAGYLVEGANGPIQVPAQTESIEIAEDGSITADGQTIGRLRIVRFENPQDLQRLDNAAFDAAGMQAVDADEASVLQGYVEGSNVNPLEEMTDMIAHFRLFETQQKMLQTTDQILGHVTRELGKF